MCWKSYRLLFLISTGAVLVSGFFTCHDDPSYEPNEGQVTELQFTWLGTLQYIHVKNGTPHYFRVPRVVLISRQFVLTTAVDAAQIPTDYALGNVVFGDYERDTNECQVGADELAEGAVCEPAVMLMPISDVLLHPEYKNFGAKNSVALLKLLKIVTSEYVLPACLPFKNYMERTGKQVKDTFFHVDFATATPRDFLEEDKDVSKIRLLPMELCYLYDAPEGNQTMSPLKDRVMCTTGCGFYSGAPSLVHEHTGHWTLVAIAQGNAPCPDPLRMRRPPPPPRHVLLHPYVPWITAAITGRAVGGSFAKDDPFGFTVPRSRHRVHVNPWDIVGHAWVGHWWMGGIRCYDRGEAAEDLFKFYHESFQIKPVERTNFRYFLELIADPMDVIICVKVGMPYRLTQPKVTGLDSPAVKVHIPVMSLRHIYKIQVEAFAYNNTEASSSSSSSD